MCVFLKEEESRGKKRKRGSIGGEEGESAAEPGEGEEEEVKTKRLKGRRIIICLRIVIGERSEPA